jgi:hypothetical protein
MRVKVNDEPIVAIEEYADVPIASEVGMVLDVAEVGDNPQPDCFYSLL